MDDLVLQAIKDIFHSPDEFFIEERMKRLELDLRDLGLIEKSSKCEEIRAKLQDGLKNHPYYNLKFI